MQAALVPVEEYLRTNYDPDREYVDGQIVERNLGGQTHSVIQRELIIYLGTRSKKLGIAVFPEQRIQVRPNRFRVPDVTVLVAPPPKEQIFTSPPHLCIEILSPDDRMEDMQQRIDDYLGFGVPYVWIISPRNKKAFVVTRTGMVESTSGRLETKNPDISVPLSALFE
jgi:Uma2 family endonuclease